MEIVTILGINVLTSFLKKYIYPKFGKVGVQFTLFILCFIGATLWSLKEKYASIGAFFATGMAIFMMAISLYEVVLQYFPIFKNKK